MELEEFQKRLDALGKLAEEKENRLSMQEVRDFLQDMELTEEQYQLVFAYLASRLVTVEGYVAADAARPDSGADGADAAGADTKLSAEEEAFLARYREELRYIKPLGAEELRQLLSEAEESGDAGAKALLTEQLLPEVLRLAMDLAGGSLPLSDLVQEGNIGLMLALETLGLRPEGQEALVYLRQEIRSAMEQALSEQQSEKQTGTLIAERLNKLSDGIRRLSDDLERQVSVEELSAFLDMPVEEIEDLLRLAGSSEDDGDTAGKK